jgi:hypothetical protein
MELFDTFPAFEQAWVELKPASAAAIRSAWETYLAPWPDLLQKQIDEYDADGLDWQDEAGTHVFPNLAQRLPAMCQAHAALVDLCIPVWQQVKTAFELDWEPLLVIYVGIGLGAGWATRFRGQPAVLLGLENIAEEGWIEADVLRGLLAHELGHLAHAHWREQAGCETGRGGFWQLYEEGFAQSWEIKLFGSWHMQAGKPDWLDWCQNHTAWLVQEFLRRSQAGEDLHPFFGSWFELQGYKQTGYYLGCKVLERLERSLGWRSAATLRDVDAQVQAVLAEFAA